VIDDAARMNTIFNFGDPHKDFRPVADMFLGQYQTEYLPITNNRIFHVPELQIVDAAYGPSMVLDSLTMMKQTGKLKQQDGVLFLGSMGSLSQNICLGDLVVPVEMHCTYFGFDNLLVYPDSEMYSKLCSLMQELGIDFKQYVHGSVMAVFDPSTDHNAYTNCLYGKKVEGVDCCESYIGTKFCTENGIDSIALLYCSDDPNNHIANISKEEFDKKALETDLRMHRIAKDFFDIYQ
jgi:purine-nucleoside phosphorylase